jgi:hypothetical protein
MVVHYTTIKSMIGQKFVRSRASSKLMRFSYS